MFPIRRVSTRPGTAKVAIVSAAALLSVATSLGSVSAHSYPQTMSPPANARLDFSPAHVAITYDSDVLQNGTVLALLDSTGSPVPVQPDPTSGRQSSVQPMVDMAPGPYTVAWTSVSADDGHSAQGFFTFVVNGGPVGVLQSTAQAQSQAADLMATLTVMPAADGSSLLRTD